MDTLANGGSAAQLQAWAESQNNVSTAQRHFIARIASEERALRGKQKADRVRDWLEEAIGTMLLINQRLGGQPIYGAPATLWLDLFESLSE